MNARAMPNSSLAATPRPPAWRCRNSAMIRPERSATSANTFALWAESGGDCVACMSLALSVANHPIGADRTLQAPLEMEKMKVSHRLAHGEEKLMRVELAPKQRIEHVCRRFGRIASLMQLREAQAVVLLLLWDAPPLQPTAGSRRENRAPGCGNCCVAAASASVAPRRARCARTSR